MINFSQFLLEARMAPLYHGTTSVNAIQILKNNVLKKSMGDGAGGHYTISFTRGKNYADYWSKQMSDENGYEPIIFEVDQQKLSQNYKLVPFNFFSTKTRWSDMPQYNEMEERIVDRDIINFDKYITKIIVLSKPGKPIKGNLILNHPKLWYNGKFVNK